MVTLQLLTQVSRYQLIALGFLGIICFAFFRTLVPSVLVGGLLMALNFWALRFFTARIVLGKKHRLAYIVALSLKFIIMLTVLAWLITVVKINALGFVLGMSSLFLGIAVATTHSFLSTKSSEVNMTSDSTH